MKSLTVHAPVRVDLAGGTLDIRPISAIIPKAVTLNCTLNGGVTVKIEAVSGPTSLINADTGTTGTADSAHPDLKLAAGAVNFFGKKAKQGFKITVKSALPRGSGLGTSSVILSALLSGISRQLECPMDRLEMVRIAADIEARILNFPTGVQDYIAPLFGGMNAIRFPAGNMTVSPISLPDALAGRMVLVFTGISHFSGAPNWEMFKGFFDSNKIRSAFYRLAEIANLAVDAAEAGDVNHIARRMREDYDIRKSLPVQLLPQTGNLFRFLENSPLVTGFRMCGAAGGGTVVAIAENGKKEQLEQKVAEMGYRILNFEPQHKGIAIDAE
ncbi:MAG: hypothetical protein GXO69_03295 [Acidobacteria bacterium]|nr:hypothetical protein [Acidobacteriota bacterium]